MTEAQRPQSVGLTVGDPTIMVLRTVRPLVRGVLDLPPESSPNGGRFLDPGLATAHDTERASQRTDVIDIAGASSRPGAESPIVVVEPNPTVLVVQGSARFTDGPLPLDVSRRAVLREAIRAGGSMIDAVRAQPTPGAVDAVAQLGAPVCSMHMQVEPRTMQRPPRDGWARSSRRLFRQAASRRLGHCCTHFDQRVVIAGSAHDGLSQATASAFVACDRWEWT